MKCTEVVLELHEKIIATKPDKWIGDKTKERVVRSGIRSILVEDKLVQEIFEIVKKQREYR